jgi:8-oxo-dGTP pyrophosphatase MutT (NUDIX family)
VKREDPAKAGAVCWKRCDEQLLFVLVQTEKCEWTFPKGKIEEGDTPLETALEEARQEAGVRGKLDGQPLTEYMPSPEEDGKPVPVYLLQVETQGRPRKKERKYRHPGFFNAESAIGLLAQRRGPFYAKEHERVIKAALRVLNPKKDSASRTT